MFFEHLYSADFLTLEAIIGPFLDLEGAAALQGFFSHLGCSNLRYQFSQLQCCDYRCLFLLALTLRSLEHITLCFLLGFSPRLEAPLVNIRLRKSFLRHRNSFLAFALGAAVDFGSYPVFQLGNSLGALRRLGEGRNAMVASLLFLGPPFFFRALGVSFSIHRQCHLLVGSSLLDRFDSSFSLAVVGSFMTFNASFFSCALGAASSSLGRISALEQACLPGIASTVSFGPRQGPPSFSFLLGTDALHPAFKSSGGFVVYQGCFLSPSGFSNAIDLFFPVSIYAERASSFLNIEGVIRRTKLAITPFRFIYSDSEVLRVLFLFHGISYSGQHAILDDFQFLQRFFSTLVDYSCLFFHQLHWLSGATKVPVVLKSTYLSQGLLPVLRFCDASLFRPFNHYYVSESFSRNSKIMSLTFAKIAALAHNFSRSLPGVH